MGPELRVSPGILLLVSLLFAAARTKAAPPPPEPVAPSLVVNGGFEQWQAAPQDLRKSLDCPEAPAAWSVQPGQDRTSCSVHRDTAIHHGEGSSLRLGNANTKSGISVAQRIDAAPEYRYLVRLWLKGDHVDAYHPKGVIVHMAASTQTNKKDAGLWSGVLRELGKSPPHHSGTFEWHEFLGTFDTPVDTRSLLILVELRGAGVVWVDDVRVTRLEKCIQVESY